MGKAKFARGKEEQDSTQILGNSTFEGLSVRSQISWTAPTGVPCSSGGPSVGSPVAW